MNWRNRDPNRVKYFVRRGMFLDLSEEEPPQDPLPEPPQWTSKQWDTVNQLRGQMKHLENKVIKLYEKKTEEGKPF